MPYVLIFNKFNKKIFKCNKKAIEKVISNNGEK